MCGLEEAWPETGGWLWSPSEVSSLQVYFRVRGFTQQYFLRVCRVPSTLLGTRDASQNKTVKKKKNASSVLVKEAGRECIVR